MRPNEEMPEQSAVVGELTRAVQDNVPVHVRHRVAPVVYDATRLGDFGKFGCGKFSLHVLYRGIAYDGTAEMKTFGLRVWAALREPIQKMIDTRIWRKSGRGLGVIFRGIQIIEKGISRSANVHASGCETGVSVEGPRVDIPERREGDWGC